MSEVKTDEVTPGTKENPLPGTKNKVNLSQVMIRVTAIILVIGVSVLIFLYREQTDKLLIYGYPGIFLLSFLAYGTVILPAPGLAVIFTLAGLFNPFWVGIVAGVGAAAGESIGYLAGYGGQSVFEKSKEYDRIARWIKKNAPATLILLSAIPNPFFDLAGIAAGVFRIPFQNFFFYCWLGETIKMLVFAYLGSLSIGILGKIF